MIKGYAQYIERKEIFTSVFSVRLPKQLIDDIHKIAESEGMKTSDLTRAIFEKFRDRNSDRVKAEPVQTQMPWG